MKRMIMAIFFMLNVGLLYATEYHVSPEGLDSNKGTSTSPFKSISAAAQIAQPGDVITVHEGTYRERINPPRGGTSNDKRIIYQAADSEKVVIKGSEIIKGWTKLENDTWNVVIPNTFFGDFNPYSSVLEGKDWYRTPQDGYDRHPGMVYLDEQWLTEARDLATVLQPVKKTQYWFSKVDAQNTTIWAQFKGVNPNTEMVEINVRQSIFYPDTPGRNYITVSGFTMRHAATPWAGAMSEQIGLLGTHWSKGWIIENNVISHSFATGITLGRYGLADGTMPDESPIGFVESIELALDNGWSKDTIGSHIVRNNHISHCEKNGIHGSLGGVFSTIEGNTICDISQNNWIYGPDIAGIKLLGSHDGLIKNNHIYRCGKYGIWLDWMAQGARVTGNLIYDNTIDLFVEVNHGPFLVDHNILLSPKALKVWSQGGAYAHNLFAGTIMNKTVVTRKTPYHPAHSTDIAGLSYVEGGNDRFYNNLFVGYKGLKGYESILRWPVKMSGNVFLKGAKASEQEENALVLTAVDPALKLREKKDGMYLKMKIDKAFGGPSRQLVTSELLGNARIPDLPWRRPDGTLYKLDKDYFGQNRNGNNPCPGPFEFNQYGQLDLKVFSPVGKIQGK